MTLDGWWNLSFWGYVAVALALTHVTIASVTIFLHRHQAHRGLTLHPIMSHFFRFWLWLTTGMVTREWIAIHRKHHARCDLRLAGAGFVVARHSAALSEPPPSRCPPRR